ncbi:hypothetical protein HC928_13135 [bacterium]|nr:hypothetical protein [bacterium]
MIFNDLLGNPGFGRIGFSSSPYWNAYQGNPNNPVVSLELGDAFLAEYFQYRNRDAIDTDLEAHSYRNAIQAYQNALRLAEDNSLLKASANLGLGACADVGRKVSRSN